MRYSCIHGDCGAEDCMTCYPGREGSRECQDCGTWFDSDEVKCPECGAEYVIQEPDVEEYLENKLWP